MLQVHARNGRASLRAPGRSICRGLQDVLQSDRLREILVLVLDHAVPLELHASIALHVDEADLDGPQVHDWAP